MINEMLFTSLIPCKATHPIVEHDDIGRKALHQIVQRLEWGNAATGGDIDIGPKGVDAVVRMAFWIGMYRDVAFVQMTDHRVR